MAQDPWAVVTHAPDPWAVVQQGEPVEPPPAPPGLPPFNPGAVIQPVAPPSLPELLAARRNQPYIAPTQAQLAALTHAYAAMGEEPETAQGAIAASGVRGYPELAHGAAELARARTRNATYTGGTDLLNGAMTAATPALLAGGLTEPLLTARALIAATVGGRISSAVTRAAGGSPQAQDFAGTVGSFIPGALAGGIEMLRRGGADVASRPAVSQALANAENPALTSALRESEALRAKGLQEAAPGTGLPESVAAVGAGQRNPSDTPELSSESDKTSNRAIPNAPSPEGGLLDGATQQLSAVQHARLRSLGYTPEEIVGGFYPKGLDQVVGRMGKKAFAAYAAQQPGRLTLPALGPTPELPELDRTFTYQGRKVYFDNRAEKAIFALGDKDAAARTAAAGWLREQFPNAGKADFKQAADSLRKRVDAYQGPSLPAGPEMDMLALANRGHQLVAHLPGDPVRVVSRGPDGVESVMPRAALWGDLAGEPHPQSPPMGAGEAGVELGNAPEAPSSAVSDAEAGRVGGGDSRGGPLDEQFPRKSVESDSGAGGMVRADAQAGGVEGADSEHAKGIEQDLVAARAEHADLRQQLQLKANAGDAASNREAGILRQKIKANEMRQAGLVKSIMAYMSPARQEQFLLRLHAEASMRYGQQWTLEHALAPGATSDSILKAAGELPFPDAAMRVLAQQFGPRSGLRYRLVHRIPGGDAEAELAAQPWEAAANRLLDRINAETDPKVKEKLKAQYARQSDLRDAVYKWREEAQKQSADAGERIRAAQAVVSRLRPSPDSVAQARTAIARLETKGERTPEEENVFADARDTLSRARPLAELSPEVVDTLTSAQRTLREVGASKNKLDAMLAHRLGAYPQQVIVHPNLWDDASLFNLTGFPRSSSTFSKSQRASFNAAREAGWKPGDPAIQSEAGMRQAFKEDAVRRALTSKGYGAVADTAHAENMLRIAEANASPQTVKPTFYRDLRKATEAPPEVQNPDPNWTPKEETIRAEVTTPPTEAARKAKRQGGRVAADIYLLPFEAVGHAALRARAWANPVSGGVEEAQNLIRDYDARRVQQGAMAAQSFRAANRRMRTWSLKQYGDFVGRMERNAPQDTPELDAIASQLRAMLDGRRDMLRARGFLKDPTRLDPSYFPRMYRDMGSNSRNFLNPRTYTSLDAALQEGFRPITNNPIRMALMHIDSVDRMVMQHDIFTAAKDGGYVKWVKAFERPPEGFERVEAPFFQPKVPKAKQGFYADYGGYWAPKPVARTFGAMYSKGLLDRDDRLGDFTRWWHQLGVAQNAMQLGVSAFHLTASAINAMASQTALSLKQVSRGDGQAALVSLLKAPFAPVDYLLKGNALMQAYLDPRIHPELQGMVDSLNQAGGRAQLDPIYKNSSMAKFFDAWGNLKSPSPRLSDAANLVGHSVGSAMEGLAYPIMQYAVPRLKLGAFAALAKDTIAKLPEDAPLDVRRAAVSKAWNSIDNRFGQMVYDNLFWNKTLKDLGMLSLRSLGWDAGSVREFGGGIVDTARQLTSAATGGPIHSVSDRQAFSLALPLVVGTLGSIYAYMLGQPVTQMADRFYPRNGGTNPDGTPSRDEFASYIKDYASLSEHPMQALVNKSNPVLEAATNLYQNRDFYNMELRDPNAPAGTQALQTLRAVAKTFEPMTFQNFSEYQRQGEGAKSVKSFFGISPAPRSILETPAEKIIYSHSVQTPYTPEEYAGLEARSHVLALERQHLPPAELVKNIQPAVQALLKTGFPPSRLHALLQEGLKNPLVQHFAPLPFDTSVEAFMAASPQERQLLMPAMVHKLTVQAPAFTPEQRQAYATTLLPALRAAVRSGAAPAPPASLGAPPRTDK